MCDGPLNTSLKYIRDLFVGFKSVVSKFCYSFQMTATTQKGDATLRFQILLLFHSTFSLILKI